MMSMDIVRYVRFRQDIDGYSEYFRIVILG